MTQSLDPKAALWEGVVRGVHHMPWWAWTILGLGLIAKAAQGTRRRPARRRHR